MSQSLAAQLAAEQAKLKEQGRQFDITRADSQRSVDLALEEAAKARNERGVDPTTGKHYGQGDPTLGTGRNETKFKPRSFGGA